MFTFSLKDKCIRLRSKIQNEINESLSFLSFKYKIKNFFLSGFSSLVCIFVVVVANALLFL